MVEETRERAGSTLLRDIMEGDQNEFVLGMPRSRYFKVTRRRALIAVVSEYSALREIEGKENYEDLPEVMEDLKNVLKMMRHLGF